MNNSLISFCLPYPTHWYVLSLNCLLFHKSSSKQSVSYIEESLINTSLPSVHFFTPFLQHIVWTKTRLDSFRFKHIQLIFTGENVFALRAGELLRWIRKFISPICCNEERKNPFRKSKHSILFLFIYLFLSLSRKSISLQNTSLIFPKKR